MARDIAVYLENNGQTASLNRSGKAVVYRKHRQKWEVARETGFIMDVDGGLRELRHLAAEIVGFLGECKTLVVLSTAGVLYYELEKAGCSLWEFNGRPEEFLDYVLAKEEEAALEQSSNGIGGSPPVPVETSAGCYRISLTDMQANNSGFTSKQVLQPFLRKGQYFSLEVICNHIPPWLEAELAGGSLAGETRRLSENELQLTIYKKCAGC